MASPQGNAASQLALLGIELKQTLEDKQRALEAKVQTDEQLLLANEQLCQEKQKAQQLQEERQQQEGQMRATINKFETESQLRVKQEEEEKKNTSSVIICDLPAPKLITAEERKGLRSFEAREWKEFKRN